MKTLLMTTMLVALSTTSYALSSEDAFTQSAIEKAEALVSGDSLDAMTVTSFLVGDENGRSTVKITAESRNSICSLKFKENFFGVPNLKSIRCN
jgi:hypothetical protein